MNRVRRERGHPTPRRTYHFGMFSSVVVSLTTPEPRPRWPYDEADGRFDLDALVHRRIAASETLDEAALELLRLLSSTLVVWEDGRLIDTRAVVARFDGLRIVIHTREHGPAHFHVVAPDLNAIFAIADGSLLGGSISGRHQRLVEYWYASARPLLVRTWNATRPTDCPVGPIEA